MAVSRRRTTERRAETDPDAAGPDQAVPKGRIARSKASAEGLSTKVKTNAERIRGEIPAANAGWEAFTLDSEIGGPLISGAVAFRMFLWLLPFTLVTVVGFGLLADAGNTSTSDLARSAGIRGLAAQSIAQATETSNKGRWLLLGAGIVALVSTSSSLVKALWRSHELAWRVPRRKLPGRHKAVGALLGLMIIAFATSAGISKLRAVSDSLALIGIVLVLVAWAALWLAASVLLPHGDAPWTALIPGAVLIAVSVEVLRLLTVYYIAGKLGQESATYGGLGAAATFLGWFFLVSRVMFASAVLNATLWARRSRGELSGWRRLEQDLHRTRDDTGAGSS